MAEVAEQRAEAAAPPLVIKRDWRLTWLRIKEQGFFMALVLPAVILTTIFLIYPLFLVVQLSFGDDDYVGETRPTKVNYKFSTLDQYDRAFTGTYVNVFDEFPDIETDGANTVLNIERRPLGDLNGDGSVTIDDVVVTIYGRAVPVQEIDAKGGDVLLATSVEGSVAINDVAVTIGNQVVTVDEFNAKDGEITLAAPIDDTVTTDDVVVTIDGRAIPVRELDAEDGEISLRHVLATYLIDKKSGPGVYHTLFKTTFMISFLTTFIALLVGYPVAYLISNVSDKTRSILLPLVIVPFWTSILVRTFAWRIILGQRGFINEVLDWISLRGVAASIMQGLDKIDFVDLIAFPGDFESGDPLPLVFNRIGTLIGMVHIMVPFMIFPIFAVMRGIPNEYVRAAENLGAGPYMAFRRIYFPLTLPGLGAGVLLTFILSLGFFITPALLGGPKDRMVSNMIEEQINRSQNWEFAAALALMLLAVTIVLYILYARFMSFEKLYGDQR
jgi:ABC-type spermidine/putrescine transport system permease subunit I